MTDFFAVMGEPRRPWLEPDALKTRFLGLSANLHPDHAHGIPSDRESAHRRFTELNAAYQCLQEPRHRLRHLFELETGKPLPQVDEVPAALMETFLEFGGLCRQTDAFLASKRSVASPLLQVGLFQEAQQWIERLRHATQQISQQQQRLLDRLRALDERWIRHNQVGTGQPKELISELAELCRLLGYVHRWSTQVQERIVQLSF